MSTSLATSMRVGRCARAGAGIPGRDRPPARPSRRASSRRGRGRGRCRCPSPPAFSPRSTLCGRPSARTASTSAAPRSTPGTSRSGVRQPRGPIASGAIVGSPSRGTRASAPSVIRQTTYGHREQRRRDARRTTRRARARRACRPSTGCAPSGPGHTVHFALQPRLAARERGPDEREREHRQRRQGDERAADQRAFGPSRARSSGPSAGARACGGHRRPHHALGRP